MDKRILKEFLKAGFYEFNKVEVTEEGFPQGGVISPILSNVVLNGLEEAVGEDHFTVRYADDFVILGKTKEELQGPVTRKLINFLKERGLALNNAKTKIVGIAEGFDFLGYHFREYPDATRIKGRKQGIFLFKPAKANIKRVKQKLKQTFRENKSKPLHVLTIKLNQILRSWAEHYRTATSKKVFSSLGRYV